MKNQITLEDEHRQVSLHVLETLPVKPIRSETLIWPIAFLTDDCKSNPSNYQHREVSVSGKIFDWQEALDNQIRELLLEFKEPIQAKNGEKVIKPLVIRARSGFGKSVLLGKIVAELINAKHNLKSDTVWPVFDKILFSQLKDVDKKSDLEKGICDGLDRSHNFNKLDDLFVKTASERSKIVIIDSLDEHDKREQWWDITKRFSDKGWLVVWSCRDPDWDHYELDKSASEYNDLWESEEPWSHFTGKKWALDLPNDYVTKKLDDKYNTNLENRRFVQFCYSRTQLMNLFYTNTQVNEETRNNLEVQLIEQLFSTKEESEKSLSANLDQFGDNQWSIKLYNANLAKIIIQTVLNYINENQFKFFKSEELEINQLWINICRRYHTELYENGRNKSELDETIPIDLENDDEKKLSRYLEFFGIFRTGNKFRHRDFATIAYIEGCEKGLEGLSEGDKDDVIFQHFFPNAVLEKGNKRLSNDSQIHVINEFLRRNGNILSVIEPVKSITQEPEYYIPKRSCQIAEKPLSLVEPKIKLNRLDKQKSIEKLSVSQINLLIDGSNSEHCTILRGFPGTGKTYTGVESIISRQASLFSSGRTDSKSLIISLNNQLANSILRELRDNHINSFYLRDFSSEMKDLIIDSIDVFSLDQVIEKWAPDLIPKMDTERLEQMFRSMYENRNSDKLVELNHWRMLEADFNRNMFDTSGKFRSRKDYLKIVPDEYIGVCEKWYDEVKIERDRGEFSIIESCAILRNRFLHNELDKSGIKYENSELKQYPLTLSKDQSNEELTKIMKKLELDLQQNSYDIVMVDEIQDLPVITSIMLSFLCSDRAQTSNFNRFIIAGDDLQTLNGTKFDWKKYSLNLTYIIKEIGNTFPHIYLKNDRPVSHHLRGLSNIPTTRTLIENHRNHPDIVKYAKSSWENWYPEIKGSELQPMVESWKKNEEKEYSIMTVNPKDSNDFRRSIKIILRSLNSRANVSLVYPNQVIREFVKKEIMDKDKKQETWVESFDPWTIKGLERNTVVLIGPYTTSDRESDTRELFNSLISDDGFVKANFEVLYLMKRKMLVSNTRSVDQLILVNSPPKRSRLDQSNKYNISRLDIPSIPESIDYERIMKISDLDTLEFNLGKFFGMGDIDKSQVSLYTISEGLELISRIGSNGDEWKYYSARKENVLNSDSQDSELWKFLDQLITLDHKNRNLGNLLIINDIFSSNNDYSFMNKNKKLVNSKDYYFNLVNSSIVYDNPWNKDGLLNLQKMIIAKSVLNTNLINLYSTLKNNKEIILRKEKLKLLDNISQIMEYFSTKMNLPIFDIKEQELPTYLLTEDCSIFNSDVELAQKTMINRKTHKDKKEENILQNKESNLQKKFVESLNTPGIIKIDNAGELISSLSNISRALKIDTKKMNILMDFLLQNKTEKRPFLSTFSVNLIRLYSDFYRKNPKSLNSVEKANQNFKKAIKLLFRSKSQSDIKKVKKDLLRYIKLGCPGKTKKEIRDLIQNLMDNNLHDDLFYIKDKEIISWQITLFGAYISELDKQTEEKYQEKVSRILMKSKFISSLFDVDELLTKSYEFAPFYDLPDVGMKTLTKFIPNYNNNRDIYEDLIEKSLEKVEEFFVDSNYTENLFELDLWSNLIISKVLLKPLFTETSKKLYENIYDTISEEYISYFINDVVDNLEQVITSKSTKKKRNFSQAKKERIIKNLILIHSSKEIVEIKSGNLFNQYPSLQMYKKIESIKQNIFSPHNKKQSLSIKQNMQIMNVIYSNWDIQFNLFKLINRPSSERLYWRFDGFGKSFTGIEFSKSINENHNLNQIVLEQNHRYDNTYTLCHSFDLVERYKKYKLVAEEVVILLKKRTTSYKFKTLLQDIIHSINLFKEINALNEHVEGGRPLEVNIFPCDCSTRNIMLEENMENHPNCPAYLGKPIRFEKAVTTVKIFDQDISMNSGIVMLMRELGLKVTSIDTSKKVFSLKAIKESIIEINDTISNLDQFINKSSQEVLENEFEIIEKRLEKLENLTVLDSSSDDLAKLTVNEGTLEKPSLPKINPNELKKGDIGYLLIGWKFEIIDNKKGNSRMANVFGDFTEMGSILMTDVDYVIKDDKKYQLDVSKYIKDSTKNIEEIPIKFAPGLEHLDTPENRKRIIDSHKEEDRLEDLDNDEEFGYDDDEEFGYSGSIDGISAPIITNQAPTFTETPAPTISQKVPTFTETPAPTINSEFGRDITENNIEDIGEKDDSELIRRVRTFHQISEEKWNRCDQEIQMMLINSYRRNK